MINSDLAISFPLLMVYGDRLVGFEGLDYKAIRALKLSTVDDIRWAIGEGNLITEGSSSAPA